jgi:hypothetical protein
MNAVGSLWGRTQAPEETTINGHVLSYRDFDVNL